MLVYYHSLFLKVYRLNSLVLFLFSLEVNIMVFVQSSEVLLIVSVTGSNSFFFSYSHESFVFLICLVIVILLLDFLARLTRLIFLNHLYFYLNTIFMLIKKLSFQGCIQ